ncbi:MAG: hypothetical protein WKF89_02785 [Chitinophagaceae bacterium]
MKTASLQEIKQELNALPPARVLELCIRLVKSKKENKELLSYLLFDAHDEQAFVQNVKEEIETSFEDLPKSSTYLTKKSLRKILRTIARHSRQTGSRQVELEMLLHFCISLKGSGIPIQPNIVLGKLYKQQVTKVSGLLDLLHEDLRYDYMKIVESLH